jgi:toxin HigB-1
MTTLLPESDNAERARLNPAHVGDVDAILRARSLTFPCKPSIVAAAIGQTFMPVQLSNWFRRWCRFRGHAAIVTTTVRHFLTIVSHCLTKADMIRSFRDKALERLFATGDGRRLSVQNTKRIANILRSLDDASRPEDMNLPGFRFHALVGRDKGRYAVSASGNWRMTFGWIEGDAVDVDLEDYH